MSIQSEIDIINLAKSALATALINKFGVQRKDVYKDGSLLSSGLYNANSSTNVETTLKRLTNWAVLINDTVVKTTNALIITKNSGTTEDADKWTFNGSSEKNINLGTNAFSSTAYLPLAGGTMSGNLVIPYGTKLITSGDWTNSNGLYMYESSDTTSYGGYILYGASDKIHIGTWNNSATGTDALTINRGSTIVDFKGTPTVNSTSVSLEGHTHTKSAITDFPSSLPANGGTATYSNYLNIHDTRNDNTSTSGNRIITAHFKSNSADGLSDGGSYHLNLNMLQWGDSSGGNTYNLGFTINGNIWTRTATIGGSWGSWRKFAIFDTSGNLTASGAFYTNSDIRYKDVKSTINLEIKDLASIPLFNYTWKDSNRDFNLHSGTSALEIEKILPNIVTELNDGFKSLDYATLGTIAGISACKELVKHLSEIDILKHKNEELEKEIKLLKEKLYGSC